MSITREQNNSKEAISCNCSEACRFKEHHSVTKDTILETGNGHLGPISVNFNNSITQILNYPIATASINTSFMKSPKLLIDFTGILNTRTNISEEVGTIVTFNFSLKRSCKNIAVPQVVTTFTFNFSNRFAVQSYSSRTLKFEYGSCDKTCKYGCCTYTLELTSISNVDNAIVNFSISEAVISILAFDSKSESLCTNLDKKFQENTLLNVNSNSFYSRSITIEPTDLVIPINDPILTISVDTTRMCKPKLLLTYTGILSATSLFVPGLIGLYFTLYKTCHKNTLRKPLKTFVFNYSNIAAGPNSQILRFEYSPCNEECIDCCTYILELTSISIPFEDSDTIELTISNSIFSALTFNCSIYKADIPCKNIMFSSNTNSLSSGAAVTSNNLNTLIKLPIISTAVNTTCLNKPKLLVGFTGTLGVVIFSATPITFNFTLYRICESKKSLEVLKSFTFILIIITAGINEGNTLKFEYAPCEDDDTDCCTYILELTSITVESRDNIAVSISDAVLSVLAVT